MLNNLCIFCFFLVVQHVHTLASRSFVYNLYNPLLFCNTYIDWFHGRKYRAFLIQRFLHQQAIANWNKVGLRIHFWIQKLLLTNFKVKAELLVWSTILPSWPSLMLAIFVANVFHIIVETSLIKNNKTYSDNCMKDDSNKNCCC